MDYMDFIWKLKSIAIDNGLRVFMDVPEVGSGFFFYCKDVRTGRRSDYICWDECRETSETLFSRLEESARKFRQYLDGKYCDGDCRSDCDERCARFKEECKL